MGFSDTLTARCTEKQREINQRGLMAYPVDDAWDRACQAQLAPNPALHAQMQQTFAANSSELKLLKVACVAEHETQERVLFHAQSSALLPLQSENSSTVSGLT